MEEELWLTEKKVPFHLSYLFQDRLCTVIDVDE